MDRSVARRRIAGLAIAGALVVSTPTASFAQSTLSPAREAAVTDPPLSLDAVYTGEVWRNEGGLADGWRYLDNLDLTASADLDRLAGLINTRAFAYLLYNNGASLSELAGDAMAASNIETGVRALRIYEAWVEHDFAPGVGLRAGLYDINSEFDSLDAAGLFIGSAHGIGADISQSGQNGPSVFPVTSLAARLAVEVSPAVTMRAAVLDAVPGDPGHPARTAIVLGQGALAIGEIDWHGGPARLLAGAWRYSERQPRIDGSGEATSQGVYLRGESCAGGNLDCPLGLFFRVGFAASQANPFASFLSAGANYALGADTRIGLALAHAVAGDPQRAADPRFGNETVIELTATHRLSRWLTIQPDVQLIRRAAGAGARHAQAIGLRMTIAPGPWPAGPN